MVVVVVIEDDMSDDGGTRIRSVYVYEVNRNREKVKQLRHDTENESGME